MKLLTKYNQVNILATVIVLLAGSVCYYFILKTILLNQLDNDLRVEQQEITDYVKENKTLPEEDNYKDQKILFENTQSFVPVTISSMNIFDSAEKENIPSRSLVFTFSVADKMYKAYISKSQVETEDIIKLIVLITLTIVVLLLVVLFFINRFVLNKLWTPFNNTLKEIQQFNLNTTNFIHLKDDSITEFRELNQAVTIMSNRVKNDYAGLKSFTENASHEIQTPLAIISTKIELLMQAENFTDTQMHDIVTIQQEVSRLSKLNRSLLLLTKIDNQQFPKTELVDLSILIDDYLINYEELIAAKKITCTKNTDSTCKVIMNEAMAQILVSNLINNAIKHNIEMGSIDIKLKEKSLTVSNTGNSLSINPDELFERFKKDKIDSESLGLGLAIVKKICERYNFKIRYEYMDHIHTLTISF